MSHSFTGVSAVILAVFFVVGCSGEQTVSKGEPRTTPPETRVETPVDLPGIVEHEPSPVGSPQDDPPSMGGDGPAPGPRGDGADTPDETPPMCDEGPNKPIEPMVAKIFYGTDRPSHVPLSPEQILAVGNFNGCSGMLITPNWVLTASHCGLSDRAEFCIGPEPNNSNICVRGRRAVNNPRGDMTLLELSRPMTELAPDVIPVPIFTDQLDDSWIGSLAEAAGYGQDENGRMGRREFVAEPIVELYSDTVTVDGEGEHGVCFGDSGGPLLVIAADGSTRVAGTLSNGDGTCVGRDNFTRVDTYRNWIEGYTGPTPLPGPQPCGDVPTEGACQDGVRAVEYCGSGDELVTETCEQGRHCAWSSGDQGWRCIPSQDDPCQGLSYLGACIGGVLSWCDRGVVSSRNCTACGEVCGTYDSKVGYRCLANECDGMPAEGRCEGDVAVWCTGTGQIQRRDCGTQGQTCGFVDDEIGHFCTGTGRCNGLSYQGECDGQVAIWCDQDGNPKSMECSRTDRMCRYVNDNVGFYCTDCGDVTFQGQCDGNTAVWCNRRGQLETRNCADNGQVCRHVDDDSGFFCADN